MKHAPQQLRPSAPVVFAAAWLALMVCALAGSQAVQAQDLAAVIDQTQPKIVKIYGAGGFRGLEPYQSGFLISSDGHVLTVWSYVLDTDYITVTLNDGRRFDAKLLAADPRLEVAVLKIGAERLPHFDLAAAATAELGTRVLAFSNLFGVATGNEAASVQHGVVAVKTRLQARRGTFDTPYNGPVYVLDAMTNNPGAAGGALVDHQGRLVGLLGKELRNSLNNTWLNYALPIAEIATTVEDIQAGRFVKRATEDPSARPEQFHTPELLGLVLVPDVLERTPPFLDAVRPGSPAARAGLLPDDLILFVNDRLVQSCKAVVNELEYVDRIDAVKLTVLRAQELVDVQLRARETEP